jgi:hypothetical protein
MDTYSIKNGNSAQVQIKHLAVQEPSQLPSPSPSPSPSPRSSSPSLVISDSSAEYTGTLSAVTNGHRYSGSFEKAFIGQEDVNLSSPLPISKTLPAHELHDIPEEKVRKPRKLSVAKKDAEVLKLSAAEIEELTSAPESLPVTSPIKPSTSAHASLAPSPLIDRRGSAPDVNHVELEAHVAQRRRTSAVEGTHLISDLPGEFRSRSETTLNNAIRRPGSSTRAFSSQPVASGRMASYTKPNLGQTSPKRKPLPASARPEPLDIGHTSNKLQNNTSKLSGAEPPSPIPQTIPLPPMSIPTYLQLELSSTRPSPLYIYRSAASEFPYESSRIKFERLLNFLMLPPQLEQVLYFGSLACLDAWLYTFTILPLRFFKAAAVLIQWWGQVLAREVRFISGFIYHGTGRMWHRRRERRGSTSSSSRSRSVSRVRRPAASTNPSYQAQASRGPDIDNTIGTTDHLKVEVERKPRQGWGRRHRRTKSQPSLLSSYHKADLLQGAVIICSCMILMKLDASRMYHSIRGQAAMKLYVIYNVLEVGALSTPIQLRL